MDQDTAQVLFREGAFLLLQDVPEGTEFGIDYNSWTVGPNFRGLKMIPPGVHFVYFSAKSKEGDVAPRSGFFFNCMKREIIVKKWIKYHEEFQDVFLTDDQTESYRGNMKSMDGFLAPYPYENYKKWVSLTNHMSWEVCQRLQPENGKIMSVTDFISSKSDTQSRKEEKKLLHGEEKTSNSEIGSVEFIKTNHSEKGMEVDTSVRAQEAMQTEERKSKCLDSEKLAHETQSVHGKNVPIKSTVTSEPKSLREAELKLPEMAVNASSVMNFNKIPDRFPKGSSPAEITKYSMDSSYALDGMLSNCYHGNENAILGEIQFSFICLLIGQVYDAFDQWKKLVHLLCSCEEAIESHANLFTNFITVLYFQVQEIPEDFFVDIVSQNNFLTTTFQEFFSILENRPSGNALRKKGLKFREHLTEKFKWDFTSEPDEYAPVIVDING